MDARCPLLYTLPMPNTKPGSRELARLPRELSDRLTRPFANFMHIEAAAGGVLLFFTLAALLISNSPWSEQYFAMWETEAGFRLAAWDYSRSIGHWINDALMTLFFFLVSLELKRELVLGELNNPRVAALSIAGALGGMLVPAGIYLLLQGGESAQAGWGTVMATDTAFVIGCLALLGTRIPHSLRVFMLSLAIVDDIGAILVVTIGYSDDIVWSALALGLLGVGVVRLLALAGFRALPLYFAVGGCIWLAVDASGIHATVTGVLLGLMTPARRWVNDKRLYAILNRVVAHTTADVEENSADTEDRQTLQNAEIAARETLAPVERLVMALHPWVSFLIMPLFAFANAGLLLSFDDLGSAVTLAVVLGFIPGKSAGVLLFTWLAVRSGLAERPDDLGWSFVAGGSLLAGIGFTMALFIANLAFTASQLDSAKLGIFIASALAALAGLSVLTWASRPGRSTPTPLCT